MTLLWISISASAYDIEVDGIYYNIFAASKTAKVTYGDNLYTGSISIPESISYTGHNLSVVGIAEAAFKDCSSIVSIHIPNTITTIESEAFSGCSSLVSINLPDSITHIGLASFKDCSSLTSLHLPNSVISIGSNVFRGCSSLASITLPNSITKIESGVFGECEVLTSINLPETIMSIGSEAFSGCTSLVSINLPNSIANIGSASFKDCSSLTSLNLPNSLTKLEDNIFTNCGSLENINLPQGLLSIGKNAFSECTKLQNLDIPNTVTSIGDNALYHCDNLIYLGIGGGIKSITGKTLWGCSKMETLEIKASSNNLKLGDYSYGSNGQTCWGNSKECSFENLDVKKLIIKRPIQYLYRLHHFYSGRTSSKGSDYFYEFPFANNSHIESITLAGTFTFKTDDGFFGEGLSPHSYRWYWTGEFYIQKILNLKQLTIDNADVLELSSGYISNCNNLEEIILNGVKEINQNTFENFTNINKVQLNDIIHIKSDVFKGCSSLQKVELPASVESISNSFVSCPLDTIVLNGQNPPSSSEYNSETYLKCVLIVPFGYKDIYTETSPWNNFWNIEEMPPIIASAITLNEISVTLKEKDIFQLIATISPEDATDKIVWSSSNITVATVSEDGLVTGVSFGEAVITATCGYISATCTVVVTETTEVENIIMDESSSYSVYTVDGRLVRNNLKKQELEYLPKGIYIIVSEKGHYKISI